MKIGAFYNKIDRPWGGINTFFRNFIRAAETNKQVELVEDLSIADIVLSAGHYRGPGKTIKPMFLNNISNSRKLYNPMGLLSKKGGTKIVFRVDGLRSNYAGSVCSTDKLLIDNFDYADGIVFQSKYSRYCFENNLETLPAHTCIIRNGADQSLFYPEVNTPGTMDTLKLVTSSWSENSNKGFDLIAAFSKLPNVMVSHIGRWPKKTKIENVTLLGEMKEKQIAAELTKYHYLLFPSKNEACSNTVTEALSCGLPILYHSSGGTIEQCGDGKFGIPVSDIYSGTDLIALQELTNMAIREYPNLRKNILDNVHTFSFSYCFDGYVAYFNRLLGNSL